MRTRLPPLFSLQVFEVAARLGNFSQAATQLSLTPGVVSRQIRHLEQWCSMTLFTRQGPRVELTSHGRDLLGRLRGPLEELHRAVYPEAPSGKQLLRIDTVASIAKAWLIPRLSRFALGHPDVSLVIHTDYAIVQLPPHSAVVAIRHGGRPSGDVYCETLFTDRLVAVAAPAWISTHGTEPTSWSSSSILRNFRDDTAPWFSRAGISEGPQAGITFNDADALLQAAECGLGVAISRLSVAWPRLSAGKLGVAFPHSVASPRDNLLVYRCDSAEIPAVAAFVDWVRQEGSTFRDALVEFETSPGVGRSG